MLVIRNVAHHGAVLRALWRRARGIRLQYSSNSCGFSSLSHGEDHIDKQILDLNKELEAVFGPCDGSMSADSPLPTEKLVNDCTFKETQRDTLKSACVSKEQTCKSESLTHVDAHGKASMVNVSEKSMSKRVAVASGKVMLGQTAFMLVSANQIAKGDVLTVAKIAGIQGAKQTGNLIPLCHNVFLSNVQIDLKLDSDENAVHITAQATAIGTTGVEMEALTAVSIAALTIYDMCKAVSKYVKICNIQLESKTGGKSGDWSRGNS